MELEMKEHKVSTSRDVFELRATVSNAIIYLNVLRHGHLGLGEYRPSADFVKEHQLLPLSGLGPEYKQLQRDIDEHYGRAQKEVKEFFEPSHDIPEQIMSQAMQELSITEKLLGRLGLELMEKEVSHER